jgi:hypothetical protein
LFDPFSDRVFPCFAHGFKRADDFWIDWIWNLQRRDEWFRLCLYGYRSGRFFGDFQLHRELKSKMPALHNAASPYPPMHKAQKRKKAIWQLQATHGLRDCIHWKISLPILRRAYRDESEAKA